MPRRWTRSAPTRPRSSSRLTGALALADGAVRWPGREGLSFVPDDFMDDPERTKAGLRAAFRRLLELDFDLLLLAHGGPVTEGAKDELRALVESAD